MSASVLVCRELQQSGQLLLRVAANGCVFQAAGGGGAGRQVLAAPATALQHGRRGEAGNVVEPPVQPSATQEGTQAAMLQADGMHLATQPPHRPSASPCAGQGYPEAAWSLPWAAQGSKQPAVPRVLGVLSLPGASQKTFSSLAWKVELQRTPPPNHPQRETRPFKSSVISGKSVNLFVPLFPHRSGGN